MDRCEICGSALSAGHCEQCPDDLRARYGQWQSAAFPFTAQPPDGAVEAQALGRLRRSLLQGDYAEAEALWAQILAGLRPIGADGRRQLGEALDAFAVLKEHLGKADEARRLRQRAATARKDPSELRFKQSKDEAHHWDGHAVLRKLDEGPDEGRESRVAAVQRELDEQLRRQEQRTRVLKVGACGLAGVVSVEVLGLPVPMSSMLGGVLGAGLGWAWVRRG